MAKPATSVWYTATAGMRRALAAKAPAAPRTNGEARWTTSGRNLRRMDAMLASGTPMGSESTSGTITVGTRSMRNPR